MLRPEDLKLIEEKGITSAQVEEQLERFATGFPYLRISSAARVGNGIKRLSHDEEDAAIDRWKRYLADGGEVEKFVPASGAASRMFKALFEYIDGDTDELKPGTPVAELLADPDNDRIHHQHQRACFQVRNALTQAFDNNIRPARSRTVSQNNPEAGAI